jgi:hypothetical protein
MVELGRWTNVGPLRRCRSAPGYIYPSGLRSDEARKMTHRFRLRSRRAGVVLDVVVAVGLIVIGAFVLEAVGVSWADLVHGVERFFGL